jgi:membrane protein YqaA with SNARE-associated domain
MGVRKRIHAIGWVLNITIVLLLVWSFLNYRVLENNLSVFVQAWGLLALVIIVIVLEGAPVVVGGNVTVAVLMAAGVNPWVLLPFFLVSAIIGNIFYYYLGYFSGKKMLKYFDEEDRARYFKLFEKYGRATMLIMAISPVPYLPSLAGFLKMSPWYMFTEVLAVRLIRHVVVFFVWYFILV